ncbi:MAG: DMT family transporter [Kiritimatiellae bacterium]|nr:DMT family transporter [Kiritimatiellia bacterium]
MQNRTKGIVYIIMSAFGFALMAFFVRLCDDYGSQISSFQKSFFRNFIALLIATAIFIKGPRQLCSDGSSFSKKALFILLLRSAAGCIGIFANFYALSKIPIADAMALNKTAPFFTVLFSWLFLKEKTYARQFIAIAVGFAGVLMVIKPSASFSADFPAFTALIGGLGAGIAYTCVRKLGVYKANPAFIVLFFSAFSSIASIPFIAGSLEPMTIQQIAILLGAGASAAIGQFGVTMAYSFAPPRQIAVYDYSNIIFTGILGFVFFSQIPDALSLIGFTAIISAALFANRK